MDPQPQLPVFIVGAPLLFSVIVPVLGRIWRHSAFLLAHLATGASVARGRVGALARTGSAQGTVQLLPRRMGPARRHRIRDRRGIGVRLPRDYERVVPRPDLDAALGRARGRRPPGRLLWPCAAVARPAHRHRRHRRPLQPVRLPGDSVARGLRARLHRRTQSDACGLPLPHHRLHRRGLLLAGRRLHLLRDRHTEHDRGARTAGRGPRVRARRRSARSSFFAGLGLKMALVPTAPVAAGRLRARSVFGELAHRAGDDEGRRLRDAPHVPQRLSPPGSSPAPCRSRMRCSYSASSASCSAPLPRRGRATSVGCSHTAASVSSRSSRWASAWARRSHSRPRCCTSRTTRR